MARLPVTEIWRETLRRTHAEAGVLFTVAAAFLLLPNLIVFQFVPELAQLNGGALPRERVAELTPVALLIVVIQFFAQLALTAIATDERQSTVADSLRAAFACLPRMLGLLALLFLGVMLLSIVLSLLLAVVALSLGAKSAAAGAAIPVLLIPIGYLALRLSLVLPVLIGEGLGPVATVKRSWALTRSHLLPILALMLLWVLCFFGAAVLVSLVSGAVVGVIIGLFGAAGPMNFVAALISTLVAAVFSTYLTVMLAAIWLRLRADR